MQVSDCSIRDFYKSESSETVHMSKSIVTQLITWVFVMLLIVYNDVYSKLRLVGTLECTLRLGCNYFVNGSLHKVAACKLFVSI